MTSGLASRLKEAWEVPRDLLLRRYPAFVTGGGLPRGDIPVFVLHSAEPRSLERRLRHLADNGYATLDADEYVAVIEGTRPAPDRAVVLTFDDGRGSLWTVAQPLLRRYGMKAVVFLVPGRMRSRPGPPGPTWTDVEEGLVSAEDVRRREDRDDGALLSWEEVGTLAATGLFDFQSHSLTHARVHVGPTVVGFATPATRRGYDAFDQPLVREGERDLLGEEVPLGTPLLESAPRTSEAMRFFEDPGVRRGCVEMVAAEGGTAFFDRPGWRERLEPAVPALIEGRRETPEEREGSLRTELHESKRLIEERTGRPVNHLCYPWHAFGPTVERLAREAGYRSAFCGKVPGVRITRAGDDPRRIARVGEDYVELLPGRGRASLAEVLRRKWTRRFSGGA